MCLYIIGVVPRSAQGVLHGAFASDRSSSGSAALRGSCRAAGQSPSADIARSSPFIVQALVCACGQLSSCDSFSEAQADGADELVYRDQLFPHEAYRHCFEVALERTTPRQACRLAVQLLSLAHDHNCEARLAQQIEQCLRQGTLPDVLEMQKQFAVQHGTMPQLHVESSTLASYASLLQQGAES